MHRIGALIFLLFSLVEAKAADIDVKHLDNGSMLIAIEGEFETSDIDTFRTKVASLPAARASVALRSDGGSLVAGIRIGSLIREKKFTTIVPDGASCASACALAWLGGHRRLVGLDSSVGFHSAYVVKSQGPTESGYGNAILGAYLNQLGLSEKAILYVTKAGPTSMQWMSLDGAAEHGIAVAQVSPHPAARDANAAAIVDHLGTSPEQRARDVVRLLVERSSGPRDEVLPFLEGLYAETVVYHGKSTPRQAVLRSKYRLTDRWSDRTYTIRSLVATCAGNGQTCRVKGVVSWKYYDARTTSRSRGIARLEYKVLMTGETPQIVAESRFVHGPRAATAGPLTKAQRDFRQLLAKVSKLIQ
ncbi:MAG: hypothetical protein GEU95_13225 [Rhizobiales bacterium]|nr:hypothetical protein [Hyphomicrobiales bacterium]